MVNYLLWELAGAKVETIILTTGYDYGNGNHSYGHIWGNGYGNGSNSYAYGGYSKKYGYK